MIVAPTHSVHPGRCEHSDYKGQYQGEPNEFSCCRVERRGDATDQLTEAKEVKNLPSQHSISTMLDHL